VNCEGEETPLHLFLPCNVVDKVWKRVLKWLEFNFITPSNLFVHLECWSEEVKKRKIRKGMWLIWHASIRVIWRARNDKLLKNCVKEIDELVEEIKVLSRHWSLTRLKIASCLFYEWS
jgi:hypothetical protein